VHHPYLLPVADDFVSKVRDPLLPLPLIPRVALVAVRIAAIFILVGGLVCFVFDPFLEPGAEEADGDAEES
jgi:hypothetical protein